MLTTCVHESAHDEAHIPVDACNSDAIVSRSSDDAAD